MRRARRWMRGGLAAGCAIFLAVVADQVVEGPLAALDQAAYDTVRQWREDGVPTHELGEALSVPGDGITTTILVVLASLWMVAHGQRALAGWCAGIGIASAAIITVLKHVAQRPRPPVFGDLLTSYSFPSGHTFGATAALGAVLVLATETYLRSHPVPAKREPWVWAGILLAWLAISTVTGLARVLAGEHWLTDVMASWALGLALVAAVLLVLSHHSRGGDPGPTPPEAPGHAADALADPP